ncbi:MAG: hypothetical protein AAFU54_25395 [Chloroflexota bacterium]
MEKSLHVDLRDTGHSFVLNVNQNQLQETCIALALLQYEHIKHLTFVSDNASLTLELAKSKNRKKDSIESTLLKRGKSTFLLVSIGLVQYFFNFYLFQIANPEKDWAHIDYEIDRVDGGFKSKRYMLTVGVVHN